MPLKAGFLSVDPLAEKYPEWTPFAYTLQNPIKYTDPDGKEIVIPFSQIVYGSRDAHEYFANQVVQALNKCSNDKYRYDNVSKQIEIVSKGTENTDQDFSANTERIAALIAPNELGTNTFIERTEAGSHTVIHFVKAASDPNKGSDATIMWNPDRSPLISLENGNKERGDPKRSVHHEGIHAFFSNFGQRLEGNSNIQIPEDVAKESFGDIKYLPNEEVRARRMENTELRIPAGQELRKIE